jgi:hypothetical protein
MSRQTEIPGTEVPKNPDIEKAIDAWLEAKDEQRYATDKTKLRHAGLLTVMANVGIESYPYVDAKTGKKKLLNVVRDPKAKAVKAPRWNRRDQDAEDDVGDEVEITDLNDDTPAVDNVVEMRRVKRESVENEIDPFNATRKAIAASAELDAVGGTTVDPRAAIMDSWGNSAETSAQDAAQDEAVEAKPKRKGKRGK